MLYLNTTDNPNRFKVAGVVGNSDSFGLEVNEGFIHPVNKNDGLYLFVADCLRFATPKKDNKDFELKDGVIGMMLHETKWLSKEWDKEAKKYTDKDVENIPSGGEIAMIYYLMDNFENEVFSGVITLDNKRHAIHYIADRNYAKIDSIYELKKVRKPLIDRDELTKFYLDAFSRKSAGKKTGGSWKGASEVAEERLAFVAKCLGMEKDSPFDDVVEMAHIMIKGDPDKGALAMKILAMLIK